jgi:AcrR family transcriptional regulator
LPRRPAGSESQSVWWRAANASRKPDPAITLDDIARVAVELADASGLRAVSFRNIGERIGCAPTSLYWYVSNKDQIYELMVDTAIGEIALPRRPSGNWRTDLPAIAEATRDTLARHLWFTQLGIYPIAGPQTLRYGEVALQSLAGLGIDAAAQVNVLAALNNYVFGFLQRKAAWHHGTSPADAPSRPLPSVARSVVSVDHLSARTALAGDESFMFGLNCLLDGFAALAAPGSG